EQIIGQSEQILLLKETVRKIANRNSTVLILGESGTGKEVLARAVHMSSNRRFGPFVKVNCAAIPESLLESELFGYVEGAFTGAKKGGQAGKFDLADKGTIFLDEIGDMPVAMQAKLLRVLQEKEIEPLGSAQSKKVDVRILAATNLNLEKLIIDGKFREDLYYRLNVINLHLPPLRERIMDLGLFVDYFMHKFNREFGLNVTGIHPEVMDIFAGYSWPGNIRELENVMERVFNIIDAKVITVNHLPLYLVSSVRNSRSYTDTPPDAPLNLHQSFPRDTTANTLFNIVEKTEKETIVKALTLSGGNKVAAAHLLGISRQGLYKKLDKYGLT
ncbi:MAG: sigma 54-interacting transcriptional regulator, partial [Peptococcaceae bacterium]|nr:sigma 54-interacting transcriptional regulator [Peptococcaceae bacterium]